MAFCGSSKNRNGKEVDIGSFMEIAGSFKEVHHRIQHYWDSISLKSAVSLAYQSDIKKNYPFLL